MKILGIDPGLDGALVLLDGTQCTGKLITPTFNVVSGKSNKRAYDIPALLAWIKQNRPDRAFLEKAQAMPGQGVTSMFGIGKGSGIMLGILAALEIPHQEVHPRTWQKIIFTDVSKDDTKAASGLIARRLWPDVDWRASDRCKNLHDGLTDAVCIAEYGRRIG